MRKIIIIGASSGIGAELAKSYASNGCMVGISARREEPLKTLADSYKSNIIYLLMDVSYSYAEESSNIYGAYDGFEELAKRLGGVDLVIFCAGYGKQTRELVLEQELATVDVNISGFVAVATAAVNYFIKRAPSVTTPQFVAISSVASLKGLGISASYSASKRFQLTYLESLDQLLRSKGVKISFTSILPGFVATDFIGKKNYPFTLDKVYAAKKIVQAIERRKFRAVIDWKWGIVVALWALIPNFVWRRIKL